MKRGQIKKSVTAMLVLCIVSSLLVFADAKKPDSVQLPSYTRELMDLIKLSPKYDDSVSSAAETDKEEDFRAKRLIVKMKEGEVKETYGAKDIVEMPNGITVLQYETEAQARHAHEKFSNDESVKYCISDRLQEVKTDLIIEETVSAQAETTENGEFLSWGTTRVGADQYMEKLPDAKDLPEVVVAVIDTGVDLTHPHIKDRLVPGYDFLNDDADPSDDDMHGTFCSGIVADATKENVKIMPIKLLSNNNYTAVYLSTNMAAVTFAVDNGADIINLSFGYVTYNEEDYEYYNDIISYATDRNVICVAAMGNRGNLHDNFLQSRRYDIPSMSENVLSVGATDADEKKADFSDFGSDMELIAPGVDICSSMLGGGYVTGSGTSASAPLVAACAALILSDDPDMTYTDVCEELYERAADREAPGKDIYYGYGRVDLGETVKMESVSFGYSESHVYVERGFPYMQAISYPTISPVNTTDASVTIYSTNPQVAYFCADGNGARGAGLNILTPGVARIVAVSTDGDLVSYFDLYVHEGARPKMSIKTLPDKTEYYVGEILNTDGLTLELTYSDKTSEIITDGFTYESVVFDTVGRQRIKVIYQDLSCSFYVEVKALAEDEEEYVRVKGLEVRMMLNMNWNDSDYLIPIISPDNASNKNVTFSTTDENVATVDQYGKVTAKGRGNAIIYVRSEDRGIVTSCMVRVNFTWWQWILYIFFFGFIWM